MAIDALQGFVEPERQRYWSGVMEGFYRKLREREAVERKEMKPCPLAGDEKLRAHYRYINPSRARALWARVRPSEAYQAGLEKGRQVEFAAP